MANGKAYFQARELRNIAATAAVELMQPDTPGQPIPGAEKAKRAMAFTALVKAWEAACERMRIVNGTPLPGSRRPAPARQPRRQSAQSGLAPDQPDRLA